MPYVPPTTLWKITITSKIVQAGNPKNRGVEFVRTLSSEHIEVFAEELRKKYDPLMEGGAMVEHIESVK